MSTSKITLYDIPRQAPNVCWSPNTWKARFVLNFKGLDYKTEWLDYPQMKPTFEPHVPANTSGFPYTVPTVKLTDGTFVMDSRQIADAIEKKHPSPSLRLDSPYLPKVNDLADKFLTAWLPLLANRIPKDVLTDKSAPHWYKTREAVLGMPVDKYERENSAAAYDAARGILEFATALLKENADGPFFEGKTVGFADFQWVSFLIFLQRVGEDLFQAALERTGDREVHLKQIEACRPWLERDAE